MVQLFDWHPGAFGFCMPEWAIEKGTFLLLGLKISVYSVNSVITEIIENI
jgi:hypothetical protein